MTNEEFWVLGMASPEEQERLAQQLMDRFVWVRVCADEYPQGKSVLKRWVYWVEQAIRECSMSWWTLGDDLRLAKQPDFDELRRNEMSDEYQAYHRLDRMEKFLCRAMNPIEDVEQPGCGKYDGLNIVGHGVRGLSRRRPR